MRRIRKIEILVSGARKKYVRPATGLFTQAENHATAVAAIVLSAQPRVDEPLNRAWTRALQHYGIPSNYDQTAAAARLYRKIIGKGEADQARFTEIFRTAPVWLLQF